MVGPASVTVYFVFLLVFNPAYLPIPYSQSQQLPEQQLLPGSSNGDASGYAVIKDRKELHGK